MPDQPSNSTSHERSAHPERPYAEEEISLLDILVVLARSRRFIIGCVIAFALFGVVYALAASEEYTSTAEVVREVDGAASGGVPGGLSALRGLGISVGGGASGLTPEAYPRILTSREVRLAVARDTFYFADIDAEITYVAYFEQEEDGGIGDAIKRYTIGLPGQIMRAFRSEPSGRPVEVDPESGRTIYPSEAEEEAMKAVGDMVSSSVDVESGVMTLSVTDGDPVRAAEIAESFLTHLSDRVRAIRTEKSRRNLEFIEDRFASAREDLQEAEERLAAFNDRNREIRSARLRTEQDRLQRQVRFASDLYSELQAQLTQAEIELQRSEPVLTVIEAPAPPTQRSAPRRTLIVLLSLILGGMVGIGGAFVRTFLGEQEDEEEREKLEEIKQAFRNPLGGNGRRSASSASESASSRP